MPRPLLRPRPNLTDSQVLDLLSGAPSIRTLEAELGYTGGALRLRCRPVPELWAAYQKCSQRGTLRMRGPSPGQAIRQCALCGSPSHDRRYCPKRKSMAGHHCVECSGLPWRRPRGIRVLCACGEAYEPEPPVTVADVFEQPHYSRREII
jgi:hypothetical protein